MSDIILNISQGISKEAMDAIIQARIDSGDLQGTQGEQGIQGIQGIQGEDGDAGTGYVLIGDSQYTEANPLVVTEGQTVTVDLNGVGSVLGQLPIGATGLYDIATSKITPITVNDGYSFSLGFKGKTNNNNGGATFAIDIGGVFGEIFPRNFRFPRGTNLEHDFYLTSQGFSGSTFLANGGLVKFRSDTGTSSFYDIVLQIHRTHKGRP